MLIEELGQLAADVLLPDASPDLNSLFDKKNPDQLRVPVAEPWSFKRRLNASGWFDEEIVAGGLVTQGKAQSLKSMMTGWALVELVKARRYRAFPREFCLAVTDKRVIALGLSAWSEGGGETASIDVVVKVNRGEIGSWPHGEIRIEPDGRRPRTGDRGGTLHIGGERVPVNWDAHSNQVSELLALLGRYDSSQPGLLPGGSNIRRTIPT
jgi:hypothetical protein